MISKRRQMPHRRWALAALLAALALPATAVSQEDSDCLECHGVRGKTIERDGEKVLVPYMAIGDIKRSVHPDASCIDCHVDLDGVEEFPHDAELEPADCTMCHDEDLESIAALFTSTHGLHLEDEDPNAPQCGDCHGSHLILSSSDPESSTWPGNISAQCSRCHTEGEPAERAEGLTSEDLALRYADRIHGRDIFDKGLIDAPTCVSCHGGHGVLPPDDAGSRIHKDKVNDTCKKCHGDIARIHLGTVAPENWERTDHVLICVDCHQPHVTRSVSYETNMSNDECLACHTDPTIAEEKDRPGLLVDVDLFEHSVHGRHMVACAQCHADLSMNPTAHACAVKPTIVTCSACHEGTVDQFEHGVHGKLLAEGDEDAPSCADCHGSHGIVESTLPDDGGLDAVARRMILDSPTHRRNIPDLCARCHRAGAAAAQRIEEGDPNRLEHYRESIHGKGLIESGLVASANCVDCHTAHRELPRDDPDSSVSEAHIVETCGRCHDGINEQFRTSIHSAAGNPDYVPAEGEPELPHCNDCHSAHSIARTDIPAFRQNIVQQCGACHEKIAETYFDTYHGKVTALGETIAAQCYDCHGSHAILSVSDPRSTLSPDHIVNTCAKCHEGSHEGFTTYLTHATHTDPERYPALYWSYVAMSVLLIGVFGFFGLHLLAWIPRSWQLRREHRSRVAHGATKQRRQYMRFRRYDRNLHRMVIISFLGLALTGMMLKFSETGWAHALHGMLGGVETTGWIHRLCAVITFAYFALHIGDLFVRYRRSGLSARKFFLDPSTTMVPTWTDVKEMAQTLRWFVGLGPRPRYGKWTYWEKFDYFAVFWGVMIIGFSGLVLWFPELATRFLPGWMINVATIIHSEEALLATGFIFTIHFFNAHLRPEKFPMDPVVFTGRMTLDDLKAEKPRLYEELVTKGELEKHLTAPPSLVTRRAAYIFGYTALTVGVILVLLLIYGLITEGL